MKIIKIPSLIASVVQNALSGLEGMEFTLLDCCPHCGGVVRYHDIRKKRFATIIIDREKRIINVLVTRYYCKACGKLCYASAPFYPNTKFGSPVIDLCITLARIHPYNHSARILQEMGVVVDRGTIRNFFSRDIPEVSYAKMYGLPIPLSIFHLSDLSSRRRQQRHVTQEDILRVCGFPSSHVPQSDR
ncbi:MAG TPA: hypothetical protein PK024_04350 [Methanospirillum sp.]|uniref:hypothetical protein n=1 Tax=Methanospirillum sp. TaxID=45200 RepID=UPI002BD7358B|nr:hypothetical protein [Methanospirillum sp.]HOJ96054.1 hypothetical protein [Methanospirillum sp.]HOL40971.1 hypothetical protein [Methanospirillum sp.]HPP77801.1 hypothetical protein [Methanospirillum sp.]